MKTDKNVYNLSIQKSLLIDLQYEIDSVDFSNKNEETKSYHFMITKLEEWKQCSDESTTKKQLNLLINHLQESTNPLQDCYFQMMDMIEKGAEIINEQK